MTDKEKARKAKNSLWPNTESTDGAQAAARQGVWASAFVMVVTITFVVYSRFAEALLGIDVWALVDVILFGVIALGIWKLSRVASVAGLVLYVVERIWMLQTNGQTGGILAILLILMFVNSIRGTFAYHRQLNDKRHWPDAT